MSKLDNLSDLGQLYTKFYQILHLWLILVQMLPNVAQIISGIKHKEDKSKSRNENEINGI